MRIAVFGAGGVGGYFGACLARAGVDVVFIARGEHLRALRADGIRVRSPGGDFAVPAVEATDDPAAAGQVDAILLAVKSWQVAGAARAALPTLGPDTFLVPLQNGVEAADHAAAVVGFRRVLKGLAAIISHIGAPGEIIHVGAIPTIAFGEVDNRMSDRAVRLLEILRRSGVRAEIPSDIDAALWKKLLFVASVGGVGAVARAAVGVVRSVPETRRMVEQAMREVLEVARAKGIALRDSLVPRSMEFMDAMPERGTASLQRDIASGRPSELEAWNGAVVRFGREVGVETPVHGFIHASLLPQETEARRAPGAER